MPYIDSDSRNKFDVLIQDLQSRIESCGEMNYVISELIGNYLLRKGLRYSNINEIMGILSSVQSEFYSRVAVSYERKKAIENKDILSYAKLTQES